MPNKAPPVLVVEDDPEINELVGAYVQIAGFGYEKALTGTAAVEKARAAHPALIVLDVMLPDFDGFEVVRQLRAEPATRDIPVIILTALDRDDCRARGLDAGAAAYLTKPFDPERLLSEIKRNAAVNGRA